MIVLVFGNPDLPEDSLPFRILPQLKERFPRLDFQIKEPNEEFEVPEEFLAMDTVSGIKEVKVFGNLSHFSGHPHVSLHDFDLYSHLKHLEKLGKIKKIKIIGLPPNIPEEVALEAVSAILSSQF